MAGASSASRLAASRHLSIAGRTLTNTHFLFSPRPLVHQASSGSTTRRASNVSVGDAAWMQKPGRVVVGRRANGAAGSASSRCQLAYFGSAATQHHLQLRAWQHQHQHQHQNQGRGFSCAAEAFDADQDSLTADGDVPECDNAVAALRDAFDAGDAKSIKQRLCDVAGLADRAGNAGLLTERGACELAVFAMILHPQEPAVQGGGCTAAAALARVHQQCADMCGVGAVEAVLGAMRGHLNIGVQVGACRALAELAQASDACHQRVAHSADAYHLVLRAISMWGAVPAAAANGWYAVSVLAGLSSSAAAALGGPATCVEVVAALQRWPTHPGVQAFCCAAVSALAADPGNAALLHAAGAEAAVLGALQQYADPAVRAPAMSAVAALASARSTNFNTNFNSADVCELVAATLAAHPTHGWLQKSGCWAVGRLSLHDAELCTRLGEAGACALVVGAMRRHSGSRCVQREGCYAVVHLASSPANRARLAKAGAGDALALAMRNFPAHDGIQELAGAGRQKLSDWLQTLMGAAL